MMRPLAEHTISGEACHLGPWSRTLVLVVIFAIALFFRVYDLGKCAFRADEIHLWSMAERRVPPSQLLTHWFEVSGTTGQQPFPAWVMQVFLALTGWHVTPVTVRLPFAIIGAATVFIAYRAGCRFAGSRHGLILSALLAVNPFHIALSREAYFYATAVLGYFLHLWVLFDLGETLRKNEMLSPRQLVLLAAAFFFSAYSQITGLMLCVVTGSFLLFLLWRYQSAGPYWQGNLWRMGLTYALVSTPLILAPWGLLVILRQVASSADYGRQVVAVLGGSLWRGLLETVLRFGWGSTVLGAVLALVALGAATFRFVISRDARGLWLLVITAGLVAVFAIARSAAGALYEARYMSWLLPFYLMAIAHGLDWPFTLNVKQPPVCVLARPLQFAALALIFICAYPAYLYTQLTGNPTPYWDLVKWADSNFPRGTLVLVDRWFEPWNELAVHRSTNVYFTFTVPNEPLETFLRNRWRDTAKAFFEKFPDAAYLEIAKTYYDVPEVGPWEWPRTHFARHHAITNEAGLKLRKLGLGHRGDFYAPNTNRVIVEFFYNTKEDLISRWREEGRNAVVLFGAGWGYAKPWQQTGDFRDWRILQDAAVLELYNLTDHACPMTLTISGTSVGATKRVVASTGHTRDFGVGRYETWLLDLPVLPPGTNLITLADAARPRADSMLFVDRITLTAKSEER